MDCLASYTFAMHFKAAKFFLAQAEEHENGQLWNIIAAVTFFAFTLEAYLNHLGQKLDPDWETWDESKHPSSKEKMDQLCRKLEISQDQRKEPFAVIPGLFEIRDKIAHGRTRRIAKNVRKPQNNYKGAESNLHGEIEHYCTMKNASLVGNSVESIIQLLNEHSLKLSSSQLWKIAGDGSFRTRKA